MDRREPIRLLLARTSSVERDFGAAERAPVVSDALECVRRQCPTEFDPQQIYDAQRVRHVELGPSFQWLRRVYLGEAQALGELSAPDDEKRSAGSKSLHPGLIDSCIQLLGAAVTLPPDETLVPVMLDRLRIHQSGPLQRAWCAVKATRTPSGNFVGDMQLYDARKELVAEFIGLEAMSVTRDAFSTPPAKTGALTYEVEWCETRLAPEGHAAPRDAARLWLLFADDAGLAGSLSQRLEREGASSLLAEPAEEYRFEEGGVRLDPGKPEHFERLLAEVAAKCPPLAGVVHLWSLRRDADQESLAGRLERQLEFGSRSLLHLVQALGRAARQPVPRLCVVTRGAQQVCRERELRPEQALIWGMGAALSVEAPGVLLHEWILIRASTGAEFLHASSRALRTNRASPSGTGSADPLGCGTDIERREGKAGSIRARPTYLITGDWERLDCDWPRSRPSGARARLLLYSRARPVRLWTGLACRSDVQEQPSP